VNSIDECVEPVVALADGVVEFVMRWREAFLPGHCNYRGEDPGMDPLGLVGPVDHASLCLCSRIGLLEMDGRGTYDSDVSLRVIRQCVTELWATEGRIWTGDVLGQFAFDDDGLMFGLPDWERPVIDAARHLAILEIHAARLFERAPTRLGIVTRRETSDEERDRYCYDERKKGRAWKPILEELRAKWPGDEFHSGTAAKKAADRHARRLGLVMV
jgi:hypothetical protein